MGFFDKKKEVSCCEPGCSCNTAKEEKSITNARVKILGSGCDKCNKLEKATVDALKQLGMESEVEHVTDFAKIAEFGVMTTPALVVDGKVLSYGKVLKTEEVIKLLEKAM